MDTEILKQKYQALSPQAKTVLFSKKTIADLWFICQTRELDENKISAIANEVILIILGINLRSKLADQIVGLGSERGVANSIANEIEGKILKKLDKIESENIEKAELQKQETPKEVTTITAQPASKPEIKSYDSFEQTILRQAQAMKPAQDRSMNYELRSMDKKEEMPKQQPASTDPYREPVE